MAMQLGSHIRKYFTARQMGRTAMAPSPARRRLFCSKAAPKKGPLRSLADEMEYWAKLTVAGFGGAICGGGIAQFQMACNAEGGGCSSKNGGGRGKDGITKKS